MAALAVIAKQAGYEVAGSDVQATYITDAMLSANEIAIDVGFEEDAIMQFIGADRAKSLVIATAAHGGLGNPQVVHAKEKGIESLSFGQALGMFQYGTLLNRQDMIGISVAGSHGKTTTTAMLATVLQQLGEDPSYVVGTSAVDNLGQAGHLGVGQYFVAESDEYFSDLTYDRVPKFYYQHPYAAIITNVDFDHPDVFSDIESIYIAFEKFVENIQPGGILTIPGENPIYKKISTHVQDDVRVVTYGTGEDVIYRAVDIENSSQGVRYTVVHEDKVLGSVVLQVMGEHNALNSLSVVALLHSLGKSFEDIADGLAHFTGTKRRLELKGVTSYGSPVVDDYAHHPTEVQATLKSLESAYPEKKIVCIFQPHTFSRTKQLIVDFSDSFAGVETLILLPIFTSAREGTVDQDEQEKLYARILEKTNGIFIETKQSVLEYCTKNFASDEYVIVTMGAGDVYTIGDKLVDKKV